MPGSCGRPWGHPDLRTGPTAPRPNRKRRDRWPASAPAITGRAQGPTNGTFTKKNPPAPLKRSTDRGHTVGVPALLRHRAFETAQRSAQCSQPGFRRCQACLGCDESPPCEGFLFSATDQVPDGPDSDRAARTHTRRASFPARGRSENRVASPSLDDACRAESGPADESLRYRACPP